VDINNAIPIGLIINELVSNSLKHAFPEGKAGELTITLRQDESTIVMTVHDNGPGIPADFDWRNAKSLGLRLVISLVDQLQGVIELDSSGGTTFKIIIPKKAGTGG
jgi:two-component sensor histidine kinase